MAVVTGRVVVPSPVQYLDRYGLFTVATGPLPLPIHSRSGGLVYETETGALPHGYDVTCAPGTSKTFNTAYEQITGDPFVVYATASCGTGAYWEQRAQELVVSRLKVGEQAVVENIFSQQLNGQAPGLANNPPVAGVVAQLTTVTSMQAAVSSLEDWLYSRYGLPGIIHAPAAATAYLHYNNLVYTDITNARPTKPWYTAMGTMVSFGNYAGLNLNNSAPAAGNTVLYITGQVTVFRDSDNDIFVSPYGMDINRTTNQFYMVAERTYTITIDKYVAAIECKLA